VVNIGEWHIEAAVADVVDESTRKKQELCAGAEEEGIVEVLVCSTFLGEYVLLDSQS